MKATVAKPSKSVQIERRTIALKPVPLTPRTSAPVRKRVFPPPGVNVIIHDMRAVLK